jgi:very-short-patch-repair endonuclease
MTEIFNQLPQKQLRKNLRHNMPKAEIILWSKIKNKQINNCKFRRQYSIGNFIVDFYCPEYNMVIEIDGDSHYTDEAAKQYDRNRQKYIEKLGLKVLRFTNLDIYHNLFEVLNIISKSTRPPLAPPSQGGEN